MMNLSFLEFRGRNLFINNPARKRSSATGSGFLEVLLVLMIITSAVSAQDVKVSGKVSDGKGTGLPGVSITVKGTTTGTNSDMDGNYAISAPSSATLVFSFIGFTTKEVLIGNQSKLDVELSDDIKALEEVVVVGYGTAKRKDVTGSVQSVTSKDFNAGVNPNPLQAIQGRVAGLVITQPNGDPNTSPTVRLGDIPHLPEVAILYMLSMGLSVFLLLPFPRRILKRWMF